jgi:hypothetical protein
MDNRRRALRVNFVKSAQLVTADGKIIRRCEVRDLSSRGAKLLLSDHADLPDDVMLHLPLDGVTWPCRIMRRRGGEIGVQFV